MHIRYFQQKKSAMALRSANRLTVVVALRSANRPTV